MRSRPLLATFVLCLSVVYTGQAHAAGPAVLIDVESGHVLYAEEPDQLWHPASLTKIMTAYLAFRAVKDGRLKMDQKIPVSARANKVQPSKIGLPVGAEMGLDLALRSLIIKSANDVAIMLAEAIDGSVEAFATNMNRTAQEIGMARSHFVNPNGLPDERQVTTARDLAVLARAVVSEFPEHAHYWATPYLRIGKRRLRSHNSLLRTFSGATGLKTGFICDSGFNIVATAKRDERHLAAVVLGEISPVDRSARAAALLQHGFKRYDWKLFLAAPTLNALPEASSTSPAPSIRGQIRVWNCGRRRRPAARKRPAKTAQPKTSPKKSANAQPGAKNATR
ncbi:MAG: D-alanyl-D-alanine carboxypeptidase family protein [Pseudomonadota bacterium]